MELGRLIALWGRRQAIPPTPLPARLGSRAGQSVHVTPPAYVFGRAALFRREARHRLRAIACEQRPNPMNRVRVVADAPPRRSWKGRDYLSNPPCRTSRLSSAASRLSACSSPVVTKYCVFCLTTPSTGSITQPSDCVSRRKVVLMNWLSILKLIILIAQFLANMDPKDPANPFAKQ